VGTDEPTGKDRQAYLEEQIQRQQRGEPIDVEWVRTELERVRDEQKRRLARTQRQLMVLVIVSAALLLWLWIRHGGLEGPAAVPVLGLVLIGVLTVWSVARRRRP
jgi:hypothetical protein